MEGLSASNVLKKLFLALTVMIFVVSAGTGGYWFLGGGEYSLLDSLYMTFITVTTIGYGEVIDLSSNPAGRIFTMILAVTGIGVVTYILLNVTAFVVEGELNDTFRRKKMEKKIREMSSHHIVCGLAGAGTYILKELRSTGRPHVLVEQDRQRIEDYRSAAGDLPFIEGDATDSDTLLQAGIERAAGLFAVTGDDNQNLVISLTVRELNAGVRVIARCEVMKNVERMKKAGADAVVSPTFIGGLRMASEMLRPSVVSFLDIMLHHEDLNLRIEELAVPDGFSGRSIADLNLESFRHLLLLSLKTEGTWLYNPPREHVFRSGDVLIFMTSPQERNDLEKLFALPR